MDENGNVVLGDEMLTPDSSRFWPLEGYKPGQGQPSFDKQFVRDWLKANPDSDYLLPEEVVKKTVDKYEEAFETDPEVFDLYLKYLEKTGRISYMEKVKKYV